jgi:hypothetical protein
MQQRDVRVKYGVPALTAKLAGSLPLPTTGKSDDELLTDALNEKYGNDPDRQ